ncbi:TPA: triose-phosphate isomerase [Candidatus Micrarchaeota archaeon]|nr:triose-phosphate isomerase [Candidatus Micrarchaeota archaeon]HIH29961.1 triose-phosphate isomerase [Candidatus Micrarchaeota archaeon]
MRPLIALNLKVYPESLGRKGLELVRIAHDVGKETGVRIIVAPQAVDLAASSKIHKDIFAQHVDWNAEGAFTGTTTPEAIKAAGCLGSLVNHSERRIGDEAIGKAVARLRGNGLESMICTKDTPESARLAVFEPTFIAVEPPELIGSGISVSTAKPEVVSGTVQAVAKVNGTPVLCGAGVSNGGDVRKAIELGAAGVLLASAYVKAKDPKNLLAEMAEALL